MVKLLSLWCFTAFLCLIASSPTWAVIPLDSDGVPHDFFLLTENQANAPLPILSEPLSPAALAKRQALKSKILADFASRMTPEFAIPQGLLERTAFWFDIYTLHGETHHIVHHIRYPWIVFRVVDTTQTLMNGKGPLWLRRERGQKIAQAQAEDIRKTLKKMASKFSFDHLTPQEQELYEKLIDVKGTRRAVFRQAAENIRIQLGQKDFFERGLINSSRYLPYMEEEFARLGLPTELTRLPFVESSFNEEARSKVGASGIWQIMPRTGKSYLTVNETIDERNSPLKATTAAGRLLRSYFRALNSWPLTLTSYNNGIGNTQKAIKSADTRDLSEIIAKYHQGDFRFASSNFFTCFLAALYAEKYNELLFKNVPREPLQERDVVRLTKTTGTRKLRTTLGISEQQLLKYNMDLRLALKTNASLPAGFQIHLPPGFKNRLSREIGVQPPKATSRRT